MVVVKNNVMYSCRVFYIGSASIEEGKKGVEALQEPLKERYRGNANMCEGEDMTITVTPDKILMQVTEGGEMRELQIATLSICAAVRCVDSSGDTGNMKFIPVHSVITSHEPDTDHPALFATVMRRGQGSPLECFAFICNETRDALHLVNATQTAHSETRSRIHSNSGGTKFFIDQSTEFDRTIRLASTSGERRTDTKKIYMYTEDYDTRDVQRGSVKHYMSADDSREHVTRTSRIYNDEHVMVNGDGPQTYYIKAGEMRAQAPAPVQDSETIVVNFKAEEQRAPTPPPQQTIIIDKPVLRPAPPVEIPQPEIIERKVFIDPPKPPKVEPQKIIVDVPVFREFPKWDPPPQPIVEERKVYLQPPPPPKQEPQRIVVDKPILKDYERPPTPPPPEIIENPVYIDPPPYKIPKAQKIIVDKPIIRDMPDPPAPPPPIIETRNVYIDMPEYPKQEPQRLVVEKPVFNAPKPAPRPPTPIIDVQEVPIDPPPYPPQERQRIVVEKPVIRDPGPPPPAPAPEIIEKPVYVDGPKWPQQKPQTIVVEKVVIRDPGPPPPPPPPIIKEVIKYIDPPPWPQQKPQTIVVERPVFRQAPAPPPVKPVIVEKPVVVEAPPPPPQPRQRVIVERPVYRTTYQTRTQPTGYAYERTIPTGGRSYVVRQGSPKGLRRYAWSEHGDDIRQTTADQAFRLYGQPRDFRRIENQFMNERGFARRLNNEELRYTTRGPGSYTYGAGGYRVERRGSVSS